jgi:hypothetical protein
MNTDKDRLILRYIDALFSGDLETQQEILESVGDNDALIQELWETNIQVGEDLYFATQATEVRALLEGTLNAPVLASPEEAELFSEENTLESIPVTVADVAALLRNEIVNGKVRGADRVMALRATELLAQNHGQLPDDTLSERGARTYLHRLGIPLGRWFEDLFHATAFDLEMGRRENFRMAVARRARIQQARKKETKDEP